MKRKLSLLLILPTQGKDFLRRCCTYFGINKEIKEPLKALLRNAAHFTIDIKQIDKVIEQGLKGNGTAERLLEVPGAGPQCVSRLLTTIGDINRFEGPKNLAAYYYGLVPRSHTTGIMSRWKK